MKPFIKYFVIAAVLVAILWLASGRADWTRAWLFAACVSGSQFAVGLILRRKSPALLKERSRIRPGTKSWDKVLVPIIGAGGPIAIWVVSALDVRRHWPPPVPPLWSATAFVICLASIVLTSWAMISNPFFAATVRIQTERGHKVISHGPYSSVRHPGYAGAGLFTLASPVALGSWMALIPAVVTVLVLAVRTALEDRTLQAELPGYKEYAARVHSRLIPAIW